MWSQTVGLRIKIGLRPKKSALVLQVWCCVVKHGLITLVIIMILKYTATFQLLLIVSRYSAWNITTVEINSGVHLGLLKKLNPPSAFVHFRWSWSWSSSNLDRGYFTPRSTQPSIPPGSVNEYQLRLGRQRQVWLIPIADERVGLGMQVKLKSLENTCHT